MRVSCLIRASEVALIPLSKNKTTNTIFEPKLKQALLSTDQDEGHWPGLHLRFPEKVSQVLLKAKPTRLRTCCLSPTGASVLLTYFLPVSGRACPV